MAALGYICAVCGGYIAATIADPVVVTHRGRTHYRCMILRSSEVPAASTPTPTLAETTQEDTNVTEQPKTVARPVRKKFTRKSERECPECGHPYGKCDKTAQECPDCGTVGIPERVKGQE